MSKKYSNLIKKYVANHGQNCPACESNDLRGGLVGINFNTAVRTITCGDCHSTWDNIYVLSSLEHLNVAN